MRSACLALLGTVFATSLCQSAAAQGSDVAYSSLAKGRGCRVVQQPPPGNQDSHAPVIVHCGGTAGLGVRIEYTGVAVQVRIGRGELARAPVVLGAPYDVGPTLEWRGVRAANGFRPQAAIMRLRGSLDGSERTASVLAVLRVDGDRVCAAAFLDASALPRANEEARAAADRITGSFRCGTDRAEVIGPRTELVDDMMSRITR